MTVEVNEKQKRDLMDQFDNSTLVREWISLISDQLSLIRHGLGADVSRTVLAGSVEVLRLTVDDFFSNAALHVEKTTEKLKSNGLGRYTGEGKQ